MGIDITTWRVRIGKVSLFSRVCRLHSVSCLLMRGILLTHIIVSRQACFALVILLFMAGIELNPGPVTCADLAALITNLSHTVTSGFQQCNDKLDTLCADISDLKTKSNALENTVAQLSNDRDALQVTVAQLSNAHVSLQRDLSDLRESMPLTNINARE